MSRKTMIAVGSLLLAVTFPAGRLEAQVTLQAPSWTNLTAGSDIKVPFTVKGGGAFQGRAVWTFTDAGTNRVFSRGRGEAPIAAATFTIELAVPPINPDVILKTHLSVSVVANGKHVAGYEKTMWIFPADPFANRSKWLKDLKITLYDSDPRSKTAAALKGLKVPFAETNNLAGLAELKEGVVLVGEGISFKDEPGLAEVLIQAASRGVSVLCLAPLAGPFPLPGTDNGLPAPGSLVLKRQDVITRLDKRLDASAWAPDGQVLASAFQIKAEEGQVIAEVQPAPPVASGKGWSWLQLDYPERKGRFVMCGFGLIRHWDASPTPRYLLARLLEHVTVAGEQN